MLNLNVQIGKNPLQKHKPIYLKTYSDIEIPYCYSVGEDGQIVAWKKNKEIQQKWEFINTEQQIKQKDGISSLDPLFTPVYYMSPSLNGDHQKCISLIISQLRLINQQEKTYKLITYHSDNRLRIWEVRDGSCINISSHHFFSQKILGLCQNTMIETRFLFAFSQNSIFIVDCWTMKVLTKIELKKQTYNHFAKGRINEKKQLQIFDKYDKSYKFDLSKLFKQSYIDVGRTINSLQKVQKQLKELIESLNQQKLISTQKSWKNQDYKTPLKKIILSQNIILKKQNNLSNLFEQRFLKKFPQISKIIPQDMVITVQNLFFVKGAHLWYFVGTQDGKIYGFPAIKQKNQPYFIIKDFSNSHNQRRNSVRYLNVLDNILIASWEDGSLKVYTTDNLMYIIEEEVSKRKLQNIQNADTVKQLLFQRLSIYTNRLSSSIKYVLPIYSLSTQSLSSKHGNQESAFQLQNNEVIIYDFLHHRISHFIGIEEKKKIYVVIYLSDSNEYVGIGTQDGVEVFGYQGYQRKIQYKDWDWKEWNMVSKYQSLQDFNFFREENYKGLQLIEFANRHTINQIEYTASLSSLLQETFGGIDTQSFTNDLYSKFYFLDKSEVEKSMHSRSLQNYIAVLKHKHNSYHRDKSTNTSFLLNCNLNRQLDNYSQNSQNISLENTIQNNFIFYSCFLWDLFQIPFLTSLIKGARQQFVLKRRYATQGISKTFTLYFDLNQSIFQLSKYLLTEYAIAAISFMQCYVLKDIQKADELVSVVQYFTLGKHKSPSIYISGQILSKSIISSNQNIVKASINLLISTIIAGHLNIHPLYEYFVLNLKNMEQKKQQLAISNLPASNSANTKNISLSISFKELNEIQCEWMLYLGLCVIYGKGSVEKQQVKMLLNRIIDCIQLNNFVRKPDLILVILKLLNEGLHQTWRELLTKQAVIKLYLDLFKIFFYYDGVSNISTDDKKFNFCFENNSQQQIKKMKQSLIKTIVYLSKEFNNQFIQCLTSETINQKPHLSYPASVIQILRQYLKSQKPTTYLVFYIELLLQCLSPMTPNLRKYVQKNVISTLQFMCTYKSISFNQSSQRLSIKSNNHVYIYCLRTSTKWRTISLLKDQHQNKEEFQNVRDQDCVLEMSPKGNYIALLTYKKLYVWRLSSGFWSGILGAFSQGWNFDLPKEGQCINAAWDLSQSFVTVVNIDPSLNKAYKI